MRTAQTIAAHGTAKSPKKTPGASSGKKRPYPTEKSLANLITPWQPGKSGNPGGRPKNDTASEIAKAIFENNPELIYTAFSKALQSGNAYAFQVIADRAFGKMKDTTALVGGEGDPIKQEVVVTFIKSK